MRFASGALFWEAFGLWNYWSEGGRFIATIFSPLWALGFEFESKSIPHRPQLVNPFQALRCPQQRYLMQKRWQINPKAGIQVQRHHASLATSHPLLHCPPLHAQAGILFLFTHAIPPLLWNDISFMLFQVPPVVVQPRVNFQMTP